MLAPSQPLASETTARYKAVVESNGGKESREARVRQALEHHRTPGWHFSSASPMGRLLEDDLAEMGLSRMGRGADAASSGRDLAAEAIPRDPAEAPATYATLLEEYLTN